MGMSRFWGYLSVILATLLYGIWNTFNKILLLHLDPVALSAIVFIIAGVFLFLVRLSPLKERILSLLDQDSQAEIHIFPKDYVILIISTILGSVLAPIIYLNGLKDITAVNASLLMNVEILFILIIGISFLHESFHKKDVVAFMLILTGTTFLVTNGQINTIWIQEFGSLLIIIAAFLWSIDTVLSKFISNKRDLILISALKCSLGGIILVLLTWLWGLDFMFPLEMLPYILFIGLISIGFSFVLVFFAIRQIGSTRTGSLYSFSSLFGAIFAFFILKEPFTVLQLFWGGLMILGVFIFYKK